eukprot:CAMPEP_0177634116 /NCGR_PEP_ID=MMETSP0447-20121125/3199_1 /TAXON_ID=0 /ORGANISM="Stygamoeba regulata, Strain BSH-02190019" /LENGTH=1069 /DNA_ID=CAMNT_0019135821 /DNA_START=2162 /DNA_END=5372 /DNA_ORIENTATION=+
MTEHSTPVPAPTVHITLWINAHQMLTTTCDLTTSHAISSVQPGWDRLNMQVATILILVVHTTFIPRIERDSMIFLRVIAPRHLTFTKDSGTSPKEADEEDEDEEEEDEDEEEDRAKKRPRVSNPFIDDEAEVDEDDEEDEDEEDDLGGMMQANDELSESEQASSLPASRVYRPSFLEDDNLTEDQIKAMHERWRHYGEADDDVYDDRARDQINQQQYLPTVHDPKLWLVKCKVGKERDCAWRLLQKYLDHKAKGVDLQIRSVVAVDSLKGFVYVEAQNEATVKNVIRGISILQSWDVRLVPIKEMPDVLKITPKENELTRGTWVRIVRGEYKNDIAQVVEDADESRSKVTVKLIPRLDIAALRNPETKAAQVGPDGKRKRRIRPAQRMFNAEEMSKLVGHQPQYQQKGSFFLYGNLRFKDGYLYKTMNITSVTARGVVPTIDELQRFQADQPSNQNDDRKYSAIDGIAAAVKPVKRQAFAKGDVVKVVDGDLKNLMGVVEWVTDDTVTLMPTHEELNELLDFPSGQLRKFFKMGDHIKVIAGQYQGETGLVVQVDGEALTAFSDLTHSEFKVLCQDAQLCSEVTTGRLELGGFSLHDLVQISPQQVGVIVRVDRDSFNLLDNAGNVQSIRLAEIGRKRNDRDAVAFDKNQNPIAINDIVSVVDGKYKGKQATVKHIFKHILFLHSRDAIENSGIYVSRAQQCALLGGLSKHKAMKGFGAFPSVGAAGTPARGVLTSPGHGPKMKGMHAFGRGRYRDPLVRQKVTITGGNWKGYMGIVVDATDTTARVELHTNMKTVSVPRDKVKTLEKTPAVSNDWGIAPSSTFTEAPRTPMRMDYPSTPMHSVSTPMRTPLHDSTWNPALTPSRDSWGDHEPYTATTPSYKQPIYSPAPDNYVNPSTPSAAFTPYESGEGVRADSPYGAAASPYSPLSPQTPTGPTTPGDSPYDINEMADEAASTDTAWYIEDILVKIVDESHAQKGEEGVIRSYIGDSCTVRMLKQGNEIRVPGASLEIVEPVKGDRVKVTSGQYRGNLGTLKGIDRPDAIVELTHDDVEETIRILRLVTLAKYVEQ